MNNEIWGRYDAILWALAVWREARGATSAAKLGVAWTIRNRANDPAHRWPPSLSGVVLQPEQFSSFNRNDPNATLLPRPNDASWVASCEACDAALSGANDPTLGANHYHSIPSGKPWPAWADPKKQTALIGPFRFYKL